MSAINSTAGYTATAVVGITMLVGGCVRERNHQMPAGQEAQIPLSDRIIAWETELEIAQKTENYDAALNILKGYIAMRDPKDTSGIIVNGNPGADVWGDLTGDIDADGAEFMNRALKYGIGESRFQKMLDYCLEGKSSQLKVKYIENDAYKQLKERSGIK